MSGVFQSDGRFQGTLNIQTVKCDQTANTCSVQVPAPGFALVSLKNDAFGGPSNNPPAVTFATTAYTKTKNTVTVNPSVLATSNGHSGSTLQLGSTSKGSLKFPNGAVGGVRGVVGSRGFVVVVSVVLGALVAGRMLTR
jgi:hypothetical protein